MSTADNAVEVIEKNKVKLTFNITPEEFKKGLQFAYNRNKNRINVQGFRKGKAPRKIIERFYGSDIFYDEAINHVLPDAYENAIDEHNIEPVYKPEIDVESVDENDGAVLVAEIYVKPEVTLGEYKGLTYTKTDTEPTEEEIDGRLAAEQDKNARTVTVDRPAQMGDVVTINFTGYIDDEPFEGGHSKDYELTLGSKTFIDTFEEQLVGCSAGDDVDVNVNFPEEYGKEELQGKPALFKVEVLEVQEKELPALDDEFAQDVSEFETMQEFRDDLISKMREQKENMALAAKRTEVVNQLIKNAEMDIPDVMYKARVDEMTDELSRRLWQQGLGLEQYLNFSQSSVEDLQESYQEPAEEDVKSKLVLEAVAEKEQIEVSDDDIKTFMEKILLPNQNLEDLMKDLTDKRKKLISNEIAITKALDFVVDNAVGVEPVEVVDDITVDEVTVED